MSLWPGHTMGSRAMVVTVKVWVKAKAVGAGRFRVVPVSVL